MKRRSRADDLATTPIDDDELDAELGAAFGRLRTSASGIDSMAALRSLEAGRDRGIRLIPALAGSVLLAVGVVAGVSLVGDEVPTSVVTSETDDPTSTQLPSTSLPTPVVATATVPTPVSTPTPTPRPTPPPDEQLIPAIPTPTPQPTGTPDLIAAVEALPVTDPEPVSTVEETLTVQPAPTEAAEFVTAREFEQSIPTTPAPTVETTTGSAPAPAEAAGGLTTGGGEFVGVWDLIPGPASTSQAELRILSGGEMVVSAGCWRGEATVEVDGERRLQIVPGTLNLNNHLCSNSQAVLPEILSALINLRFAHLPDGLLYWTSHDGPATHTTGWRPSANLVAPTRPGDVPATTTPTPSPTARPADAATPTAQSFDTKGFAGSWKPVTAGDNAIDVDATLLVSGEGDLALEVGCKTFAARVRLNDERGLELVPDSGFTATDTCTDTDASLLADGLAFRLQRASSATVVGRELHWLLPDGSVLAFEPT